MIIYQNTSGGFLQDVDSNRISDRIKEAYFEKTGKTNFADKEDSSWINSMEFMGKMIRRSEIKNDCGVMIEFALPSTSLRIDFILAGQDASGNKNFIIIELKQWKEAESTTVSDLVLTKYYKGHHSTHPSYQASSYKLYLSDYNENVYNSTITPFSCAYLHNYTEKNPEPLKADVYESIVKDSPLYFKDDFQKLEDFIKKYVGQGNGTEILYKIESGNIRPGKKLIEHVTGLYKGNKEFVMLDEQKIAYEIAFNAAMHATTKTTIIINGGPGTGKSVISMSLLGGLLKKAKNVIFAAPNASFREVMINKLGAGGDIQRIKYLLKGSGSFYNTRQDTFEVIVVDEAHRLKNEKAFMYKGKNQVDDVIKASKVNIFFIDEDQIIRPEDIGTTNEIKRVAALYQSEIIELNLTAQFRCAGTDGYVNWINDVLQIRDTANFDGWEEKDYEFKILSSPNELKEIINSKAEKGFNARILAGYAWQWTAEKDGNSNAQAHDVRISAFDFSMPWNSRKIGTTWAINKEGIEQVGCVHTSQGLEFDYVGVIVGNDLKINPVGNKFYTEWDAYKDSKGKQGLKHNPEELCRLVRNVYRILMTRGMKGCFVYFQDKGVEDYFRMRMGKNKPF
ncbi:MAG: DUF2075 domain-containing protein [Bacteroidota bacterium]|nr:DUF2075 domain-containing protein [Bacteroidota bacterium]